METALEHILISCYKTEMIAYMAAHPEEFEELIKLALLDKPPYSWRAAWLLWSCMEENDQRVQRYIKNIIDKLNTCNDNQMKELLKILLYMEVTEEYEGLLFNSCVSVWEKTDKIPSVRFNAFRIIVKIAKKYPDLKHDIVFLTQNQFMETLSPGAKKSIDKMIKVLYL